MKPLADWNGQAEHARQIKTIVDGLRGEQRPAGITDSRGRVSHSIWNSYIAGKLAELPAMEKRLDDVQARSVMARQPSFVPYRKKKHILSCRAVAFVFPPVNLGKQAKTNRSADRPDEAI